MGPGDKKTHKNKRQGPPSLGALESGGGGRLGEKNEGRVFQARDGSFEDLEDQRGWRKERRMWRQEAGKVGRAST